MSTNIETMRNPANNDLLKSESLSNYFIKYFIEHFNMNDPYSVNAINKSKSKTEFHKNQQYNRKIHDMICKTEENISSSTNKNELFENIEFNPQNQLINREVKIYKIKNKTYALPSLPNKQEKMPLIHIVNYTNSNQVQNQNHLSKKDKRKLIFF